MRRRVMIGNWFIWRVALFCSIGAVLSGFNAGSGNGLLEMEGFQDTFRELYKVNDGSIDSNNLSSNSSTSGRLCGAGNGAKSDTILGLIASAFGIGGSMGSLLGGTLSNLTSRKYTLMVSGIVMAFGAAILASSFYVWMLIVGRCICGIAIGIIYMTMPVYISETTPKKTRGFFCSFIGPGFAFSYLISLSANIGFSRFYIGWRVSNMVTLILALVYAIGMKSMPHSPRWLIMKQHGLEALAILKAINAHAHKDTRVDTYLELEDLREKSNTQIKLWNSLKELFSNFKIRLVMCIILLIFESATGTFIKYSSATIFCAAGISPFISALSVGAIVGVATILTILFIDKVGRKAILMFCTAVNIVLGGAVGALLHAYPSSDLVGYIVLVLLCIYALSYSVSWLTVVLVIASEIFPLSIKVPAVAISMTIFWFFSFIMTQLTTVIIGSPIINIHGFFYITTGANIFALIFVIFALPETKGVSLEDMGNVFSQGWRKRAKISFGSTTFNGTKVESSSSCDSKEDEIEYLSYKE